MSSDDSHDRDDTDPDPDPNSGDGDGDDICGATTQAGEPCRNERTEDDGFCWVHSQETTTRNEGPTYELQESLASKLRSVPVIKDAVEATDGVSESQHHKWVRIGKRRINNGNTENRYAEYAQRITRAWGEGRMTLLAQARQISTGEDAGPADAANLIRIYDRSVAGEASNQDEEAGPLAVIPDDDQLEDLLANEEVKLPNE